MCPPAPSQVQPQPLRLPQPCGTVQLVAVYSPIDIGQPRANILYTSQIFSVFKVISELSSRVSESALEFESGGV
jgi:hypothetical protein